MASDRETYRSQIDGLVDLLAGETAGIKTLFVCICVGVDSKRQNLKSYLSEGMKDYSRKIRNWN